MATEAQLAKISVESWIHAISVMARLHGWFVTEHPARHHGPTHVCLRDGQLVVFFARPSGGALMAQHKKPYEEWVKVRQATVMMARPEEAEQVWAVITAER